MINDLTKNAHKGKIIQKRNFKEKIAMQLKFDFNNMMKETLGEKEGLDFQLFETHKDLLDLAYSKVMDNRGKGWQEWTNLPFYQQDVVKDILETVKRYQDYDNVVVFGIGGSALGTIAVANALLHLRHNELEKNVRKFPRLYVEDNVDPERMQALLDVIDVRKTVFNVITKSGTTSETLSQYMIIHNILKQKLNDAKDNIIITTTKGKGTLYDIAVKEGYKVFDLGGGVGGRFSVLSPVGLVPLALVGIDIKAILEGAREMSEACFSPVACKNPALSTAFLQYISMRKGKNISVLMPYADSLKYMSDFYCQIWAESLGKATDNNNNIVHAGQTPVKALGVTDQHSQVQLYTEGPFDKVVTFLAVEKYRTEIVIPSAGDYPETDFLHNKTLNDLINYERKATEFALTKYKRANFTITLPEVNAHTIGELLQYFMYQTAYCGALLDINTYNQPGVEEGKQATFAMMGRKNYEKKLEEINSLKKDERFII